MSYCAKVPRKASRDICYIFWCIDPAGGHSNIVILALAVLNELIFNEERV
jgi:hypothetical protein